MQHDAPSPHLHPYPLVLAKVSIVDNPCVPTALFEVIKADGSVELRKSEGTSPTRRKYVNLYSDVFLNIRDYMRGRKKLFVTVAPERVLALNLWKPSATIDDARFKPSRKHGQAIFEE